MKMQIMWDYALVNIFTFSQLFNVSHDMSQVTPKTRGKLCHWTTVAIIDILKYDDKY